MGTARILAQASLQRLWLARFPRSSFVAAAIVVVIVAVLVIVVVVVLWPTKLACREGQCRGRIRAARARVFVLPCVSVRASRARAGVSSVKRDVISGDNSPRAHSSGRARREWGTAPCASHRFEATRSQCGPRHCLWSCSRRWSSKCASSPLPRRRHRRRRRHRAMGDRGKSKWNTSLSVISKHI